MRFKILFALLTVVMNLTFADNNMVGAGVGVTSSPIPINKHSQTLMVTSHLYGFKLSLKQLNNLLIGNNIPKIGKNDKTFYRENIQNSDIPKMDASFSEVADNATGGNGGCVVDATACQSAGGIEGDDGKYSRSITSFYPYTKNHQISVKISTSEKTSEKVKSLKNNIELENVVGKNYVIGFCEWSKDLCNGQIVLVSFSLN